MKKTSIRRYVEWLALTPLLVMAVGLEAYFIFDRSYKLDEELTDRGRLIARQLASSSEYGVFSNNQSLLQSFARGLLQEPDVRGVMILNAASDTLLVVGEFADVPEKSDSQTIPASTVEDRGNGLATGTRVKDIVNLQTPVAGRGESLWFYQPILPVQIALDDPGGTVSVKQMGAVILEMNRTRTDQLKSQMLWITISATGIFLLLAYYLVSVASRRIAMPVCELSHAVQALGEGHLETRVVISANVTELDILASGINDMAVKLQQENVVMHQRMEDAIRIAAIAFESHEGMMIADPTSTIMRVNKAFTRITGYAEEDVLGRTPNLLSSGFHDGEFYAAMWESIQATGLWQGEIWNRRKSGEAYPAWVNITAVERNVGEVAYYVATYTDITLRKTAENEIKNLAFKDSLTQLPNRRMLLERLNQMIAVSKRSGRYGALLFIDLDNFKPLNDQYGHEVGDLLLIEVASRLVSCVREVDTVGRFGGDEFVVILSELDINKAASISQVEVIAEKIRAVLAEPYSLTVRKGGQVITTVIHHGTSSIGVKLFAGQEAAADEVINQADSAMYQAKRDGRNLFRFNE